MNHLKPSSIFIGPTKSGTTWIYDYLQLRPEICLPLGVKETFFFDRYYDKGLDWYLKHFRHYHPESHVHRIEVAPSYFHDLNVAARIKKEIGDVVLFISLRDPIERSFSHYLHLCRYGFTQGSLVEACLQCPEIIEASCYSKYLPEWNRLFGESNVKTLFLEDLKKDKTSYINQINSCLNIEEISEDFSLPQASNQSGKPFSPKLAKVTRSIANHLRQNQVYGVINTLKKLGLRNFVFGKPYTQKPTLSNQDRDFLADKLCNEIKFYELIRQDANQSSLVN